MPSNNVVVCSTHNGVSNETQGCIGSLVRKGFAALIEEGCPDVALARNMALTRVLRNIDEYPEREDVVILMVDDDMVFDAVQAEVLCSQARETRQPVSAIYATKRATIAATMLCDGTPRYYMTGLGFIAIPIHKLHNLKRCSYTFRHDGNEYVEFCWTGVAEHHIKDADLLPPTMKGHWLSEDYCLTARFGGARLSRMGVGHVKKVPLYPDKLSVRRYGDQIPIDGEEPIPDTQREPPN